MLHTQSAHSRSTRWYKILSVLLVAVLLACGTFLSSTTGNKVYAATNIQQTALSVNGNTIASVAKGQIGGSCGQYYGCPYPGEWCAEFAKWAWSNGGVGDVSSLTAAAASFYDYGVRNGTKSNTPQVGDAVVYGYSASSDYADHVAIVVSVNTSNHTIQSVGGNEGGGAGVVQEDGPYSWTVGGSPTGQVISGYIAPVGLGTPPSGPNACPTLLSQGDSGTWVQVVQYSLNSFANRGVFSKTSPNKWTYPLVTDGAFGSQTEAAVIDFQFSGFAGLGSSGGGQVGDRMWSLLGFCEAYTSPTGTKVSPVGMGYTNCPAGVGDGNTGILVQAVQSRLNYSYAAKQFTNSPANFQPYLGIDGSYGAMTHAAIVDYQFGVGIDSSGGGQVGNRTWSELSMCY